MNQQSWGIRVWKHTQIAHRGLSTHCGRARDKFPLDSPNPPAPCASFWKSRSGLKHIHGSWVAGGRHRMASVQTTGWT